MTDEARSSKRKARETADDSLTGCDEDLWVATATRACGPVVAYVIASLLAVITATCIAATATRSIAAVVLLINVVTVPAVLSSCDVAIPYAQAMLVLTLVACATTIVTAVHLIMDGPMVARGVLDYLVNGTPTKPPSQSVGPVAFITLAMELVLTVLLWLVVCTRKHKVGWRGLLPKT